MTETFTDDIDKISEQWRQTGLEIDFISMQIIARVLRLSKAIENRLVKLHARFNLKPGEFDVLAALRRSDQPTLTPSQLYQSMLLSSGAMTSRLDRLEQKQLIHRRHCKTDRRSIHVSLTEQGKATIDKVYPAHFALLEELLARLPSSDKKQLAALLKLSLTQIEDLPD